MQKNNSNLFVRHEQNRLQILREEDGMPLLVQNAYPDSRPYIHPIVAPDKKGCLTENEPWHHLWQHGLYTGIHGVNGIDFWTEGLCVGGLEHDGTFHPKPLNAPEVSDNTVSWKVETDWRSPSSKETILTEFQNWKFEDIGKAYRLDIRWELKANCDITFAECPYGGLFLRMPWHPAIGATALDSEGRGREESEGKRGRWVAVSMPLPNREDQAGIAALDHPTNPVYPSPWRVDGNYGISPSRCILGEWNLANGNSAIENYRLFIFTGEINILKIEEEFKLFTNNQEKK